MALAKFSVNGVDFSHYIAAGGLDWQREDLDKDGSGRDLAGTMHRHRVAQKRVLKLRCKRLTDTQARALANALNPETITVYYSDMKSGPTTKTFYGTELSGGIWGELDNVLYWDNVSFQLTEV